MATAAAAAAALEGTVAAEENELVEATGTWWQRLSAALDVWLQ